MPEVSLASPREVQLRLDWYHPVACSLTGESLGCLKLNNNAIGSSETEIKINLVRPKHDEGGRPRVV
jgi:hypothetical protein